MIIDVDIIQRCKVIAIFLLQFYKVMMGTMLTLFIPQSCERITDGSNESSNKICSLTENLENNEIYHKYTMYWNILTFFSFILCYIIELKRENWAIKYLDIDNNLPDNNLKQIIVNEKKLDKYMDKLNFCYYYGLCITLFIYIINILLMINILVNDYHSTTTISTFISFTLLVQMKLYNSFTIAKESMKNDKMMSAYMSEFVSFNVLDKDYIGSKNLYKI